MHESAQQLVQAFPDRARLLVFGNRLLEWLNKDLSPDGEPLTESRARALLLANEVLDEPTRNSFAQLVESDPAARIAFYDLLRESGLADNDEVSALAAASAHAAPPDKPAMISWLALAVAANAWRSDFLLDRLDPAYPPDPYSPAGQVVKRAASFVRQQVQRSATERDKLGRKLAYQASAGAATLNTLQPETPIAPLPPHYRTPVPVRYPEYTPPVQVAPDELEQGPPGPTRAEPIRLDDADLAQPAAPMPPTTQPAIRIDASQLEPPPAPVAPPRPAGTVMPSGTAAVNTSAVAPAAQRGRSKRGSTMKSVKLRIVVQEHPDGPGLYGLQVRVSSRGVRRYVAGTTNRDGEFLCELPVQLDAGLTYDVDVTWPRDYGGDVERKSITLNADRTQFVLPFYRTLKA